MEKNRVRSSNKLSRSSILIWRAVQYTVWLIGVYIIYNLIFNPSLGINLFWNILIPIAPLLLVFLAGLWRNVCPMASMSLLFRHLGMSKRKKLTIKQSGKLNLIAIIALFIIVPMRHAIFDMNGPATAILLFSIAAIAIVVGFFYEWKSAWCSGLCPIHPVEKLYGQKSKLSLPNAHCNECFKCVTPCPDSTPNINPLSTSKTIYHKLTGFLTIGAFPGFVWGWFQFPDFQGIYSFGQLIMIYKQPMLGAIVTTLVYVILKRYITKNELIKLFAALAISCYYWFRIPALLGFGVFPGDGMLIDLSSTIPEFFIYIIVSAIILFIYSWLIFSKKRKNSWTIRPIYAKSSNKLINEEKLLSTKNS